MINVYEELHERSLNPKILFEGAQGFGLDIDWGDYPYVTSSNCISAAALMNGVPPQAVRNVWGVAKIYETYVGAKQFQGNEPIFEEIQKIGQEFGATTGRSRQVNWMDVNFLKKAIDINGVTHLVFNKVDVLEEVSRFALYDRGQKKQFYCSNDMETYINKYVNSNSDYVKEVHFSRTPHAI